MSVDWLFNLVVPLALLALFLFGIGYMIIVLVENIRGVMNGNN